MPQVDAVILAGGRGTRLSSALPDVAKVLAPIRGRPFLDFVLAYLVGQGVRRIVVSVGHLREQVIERYRGYPSADVSFSPELQPLGTGGAVRLAMRQLQSDPFIALNGDSLCRVELEQLVRTHHAHAALATLTLVRPDSRNDVGNVRLDGRSRVVSFAEKSALREDGGENLVNAGVYAFSKSAFEGFEAASFSLERDVLPRLVELKACFGVLAADRLVDIGTPERYAEAQRQL
jgi:D-glycero-alpha-D-manno-heptose 1-phosphate guanylyltransferase